MEAAGCGSAVSVDIRDVVLGGRGEDGEWSSGGEGDVCFAGDTIGVGAGLLRDW